MPPRCSESHGESLAPEADTNVGEKRCTAARGFADAYVTTALSHNVPRQKARPSHLSLWLPAQVAELIAPYSAAFALLTVPGRKLAHFPGCPGQVSVSQSSRHYHAIYQAHPVSSLTLQQSACKHLARSLQTPQVCNAVAWQQYVNRAALSHSRDYRHTRSNYTSPQGELGQ